jgi:hypothetical protein
MRTMSNARFLVDLLGRHVEGCADICVSEERFLTQHPCKAEIAQFDGTVAVDKNVGGFDVTVQDLLGARVAVVKGKQQLERDIPHLLFKEASASFSMASYLTPQVSTLAIFHDDPYFCGLFIDDSVRQHLVRIAAAEATDEDHSPVVVSDNIGMLQFT